MLALLLVSCLFLLAPFISALLWAVVLCFSCWPLYLKLLRFVGNRRTLASLLMSLAMVLVVLLPFILVGIKLADNVRDVTGALQRWLDEGPPAPPAWLTKVPLVGQRAVRYWNGLAADSTTGMQTLKRLLQPASTLLLTIGAAVASGLAQFALSILISFFLFRDGTTAAGKLSTAIRRIAEERGEHLLLLAGKTVRGVVYGILGTALTQAIIAGIGFIIAGVPGPILLAFLTFFLSVIPVGPPLIWVPAAIWLFHRGQTGWGIFMLIWGVGVSTVDNFIKPWLISQGCEMPFILIFLGVLGGAIAFGFIGVFLGPALLAVVYRIVTEWISGAAPAKLVEE